MNLDIKTPRWCLPLLKDARYKGASGGRSSGKSHFFGELVIEEMIMDCDLQFVCVREVQKSMKFSIKKLLVVLAIISLLVFGSIFIYCCAP